jgi:hypothetical protein
LLKHTCLGILSVNTRNMAALRGLMGRVPTGAIGALVTVAGLGYAASESVFTVEGGHRAVMFSRVSGVEDRVFAEGMHFRYVSPPLPGLSCHLAHKNPASLGSSIPLSTISAPSPTASPRPRAPKVGLFVFVRCCRFFFLWESLLSSLVPCLTALLRRLADGEHQPASFVSPPDLQPAPYLQEPGHRL